MSQDTESVVVEGERYDAPRILKDKRELEEARGNRESDARDFLKVFSEAKQLHVEATPTLVRAFSRLAGTSFLEAGYILWALEQSAALEGDWCEYGVAHGRTSALLAELLPAQEPARRLWLYDSFEGLPPPHEKDVLIDDIFARGSIHAYQGMLSFSEQVVVCELSSRGIDVARDNRVAIRKGWINTDFLLRHSPDKICFAFLDMDFYQSTKDVLQMLVDKMPAGAVAIVDDYGFFVEGVRTAVQEILEERAGEFDFFQPHDDKFAILVKS